MATKKTTSKKVAEAKKTTAAKAAAKKTTAKKATPAKAAAKKTTAKKAAPAKAAAKKTTAKKAAPAKAAAKKTTTKKSTSAKIASLKNAKAGTGRTAKSSTAKKATKTKGVGKKAAPKKATTESKVAAIKPAKKTVTSRKKATVTKETTKTKGVALTDTSLTTQPVKSRQQSTRAGVTSESIEFLRPSTTDLSSLINIEPYQRKPGEEYMNAQQRKHFEDILRQWKYELMEEVDNTMGHMKDEAANFPDPADRATQEEGFSLELRTRDRERKLIKKIDQALERIRDDEFGYCDACGVEIGIRRLEARPTATLCIDCKTLAEIKEKQTAS